MSYLRPRTALLGSFACLIGLAATGVLAYLIPVAHLHDSTTLAGFEALNRGRLTPFFSHIAHLADPAPYAFVGASLAAVAMLRGRVRVAIAIVVLIVATGATTHFLKLVLAHPRFSEWLGNGQIAAASWPSGHATASMTLALCGVMAVPARARPMAAAIGAIFTVSVSYAILVLGWHFPSDVIGGFFVASMWTLLAVAVLLRHPGSMAARTPSAFDARGPMLLGAGCVGIVLLVALARPHEAATFVSDRPSFVLGALVIASLGAALAVGFARALRP